MGGGELSEGLLDLVDPDDDTGVVVGVDRSGRLDRVDLADFGFEPDAPPARVLGARRLVGRRARWAVVELDVLGSEPVGQGLGQPEAVAAGFGVEDEAGVPVRASSAAARWASAR
jgi:hypothetical protein